MSRPPPRHIKLESAETGRRIRLVSELSAASPQPGKTSWVTVTRTGTFTDPRYGEFQITKELLEKIVSNFNARVYGQDIFLDVAHRPSDGAAGTFRRLSLEGGKLRGEVEWTPKGIKAVSYDGYRYLSIEYHEDFADNETGKRHGAVMLGAGLVTRPCVKRLDPVVLAEQDADAITLLAPDLTQRILEQSMNAKEKLRTQLKQLGLSDSVIASLIDQFDSQTKGLDDADQITRLASTIEAAGRVIAASAPAPSATPPAPALTAADVTRMLAEADAARKTAAEAAATAQTNREKTLADAINAATALDQATRTDLIARGAKMLSQTMDETAVKQLAAFLIDNANAVAVARQLADRGYEIGGSTHITVDSRNQIKSMQEEVDKRLCLIDPEKFDHEGVKRPKALTAAVDKVLQEFDLVHGRRLIEQHKRLAAGTGSISDLAQSPVMDRTVIREQLYALVGMNFVNFDTAAFNDTVRIPFSYRDTTAAGNNALRVYEGGAIQRAGVIQTYEETRPLPQKLSFLLSAEAMYLAQNGQLNYDMVAENSANCLRVVGEDTERLIWDEHVQASDEFGAAAVTTETLTSQCNGTNTHFRLANFPVVKPRKVYDLKGLQVGSTINPITVTYNSVVRSEFAEVAAAAAAAGTAIASGTYYVMDYNIGKFYLVDQAGAIVTPPNTTPLTVAYSRSTNSVTFDTDLGSLTVGQKWDDFMYRFGLRKAVIEDQRFYEQVNFYLASSTLQNAAEQAAQFTANGRREGTALDSGGNLGVLKGVGGFKPFSPGLLLGDSRMLLGVRNQTRFRMLKPFSMEGLQDARHSSGKFTAQKEAYGTQWIGLHTPSPLKKAFTSIVTFSTTTRNLGTSL